MGDKASPRNAEVAGEPVKKAPETAATALSRVSARIRIKPTDPAEPSPRQQRKRFPSVGPREMPLLLVVATFLAVVYDLFKEWRTK